jgi:ubiquitin-like modifier-activating enzyme ATG7
MAAAAAKSNLSSLSSTAATSGFDILQFQAFNSAVDIQFWYELGRNKLDHLQLSNKALEVVAGYTNALNQHIPSQLTLGEYSFHEIQEFKNISNQVNNPDSNNNNLNNHASATGVNHLPAFHVPYRGQLYISNTLDEFIHMNTSILLDKLRDEIWESIKSGSALNSSAYHLNRFLLLCYADLKTHKYYYWFAIPAVLHPSIRIISLPPFPIQSYFATDQQLALIKSFCIFAQHNVSEADKKAGMVLRPEPYFLVVKRHVGLASVEYLHKYNEIKKSLSLSDEILLGFIDPCPLNTNPGWPLRNLLLLAAVQFKLPNVNVLCFRDVVAAQHLLDGKKYIFLTSFVLTVKFTAAQPGDSELKSPLPASSPTNLSSPGAGPNNNNSIDPTSILNMNNLTSVAPRVVGWERNKAGKLAPRSMDVAALMDPSRLAEQSADLNLKLMRWRAVPKLDLSVIATSKCLLLGAGTLGCNVARSLLGWGIRYITFVDNGKVSYSNPVRQSLYTFEDCSNSKPKAATAAEAMKKIFPKIHAKGVELTIPMPGHAVNEAELTQTKQDIKKLIDLIDSHDAIFLLTDSRESRWLPTVLCAAKNKICINTALGFDTFLVMRHGDNYIQRPKKSKTEQSDSDTGSDESDSEEETKATDKQSSKKSPANLLDPDDLLNLNQLDLNKQTTAPAPAGAIVVPDDDLLKTFGAASKSSTASTTTKAPELPPKSDKYDKAATVLAEQKSSNNNTKSKDESSESDTDSDDSDSSVSSDQSDDSEKTKAKKAKKRAKRKAKKERRKQKKKEKKEKREKEAAAKAGK